MPADLFDAFAQAAREQFTNDRDTIGELAEAVNRLGEAVDELREEVADLALKMQRHQDNHLLRDVQPPPKPRGFA